MSKLWSASAFWQELNFGKQVNMYIPKPVLKHLLQIIHFCQFRCKFLTSLSVLSYKLTFFRDLPTRFPLALKRVHMELSNHTP